MADTRYREIALGGLWKNNPVLVQLLGLCPLLAVTTSVVKALGLGLATLFVLAASSLSASLTRNLIPPATRLPAFVLIIAAAVSCVELLMQAYRFELHQMLGIFLPLIATNCIILGRADTFAARNPVPAALADGLAMGFGGLAILVTLGALRELAGTGALFAEMHLLLGESARDWRIELFSVREHFLLAVLPPGAFILTGLLIALKNLIDARFEGRRMNEHGKPPATSRRVRVTGHIG